MTARQRLVKVAICVLAPACVKVPPFQYQDGGPADGSADAPGDGSVADPVTIVPNGTGATAMGPGYTFELSTAGSHFPSSLNIGGHQLLGDSLECADEQGMGLALYPVARINGVDTAPMGTPQLTIPLSGPYVGQVRLAWEAPFSCGGTVTISGHSTFSLFPDGRLTRYDHIENPATRDAINCTRCDTGMATTFFLTSYTTLVVDDGAFLSDGNLTNLSTYGANVTSPGNTACVRERGQSIAFAWTDTNNRLRVVSASTSPRWLSFIHDIYADGVLPMSSFEATTQIGISASDDCPTVEARIAEHTADAHQLVINGTPIGAALGDGIYGGDPRVDGYPVDFPVTLGPGPTADPRVPAGFAVWLYSNPIPATLTVSHSRNPPGTWYHEQRVSSDSVVLWFDVSLEPGEQITITGS